jgi:hypothetical protein
MIVLSNPAVNAAIIAFLVVLFGLLSAVTLRLTAAVSKAGGGR